MSCSGTKRGPLPARTGCESANSSKPTEGRCFSTKSATAAAATQSKILRVLQDGKFERVGGNETIHVDVRIIAATSRNLDLAMQQKQFRPDLYFRLNTFTLVLPPLRERADDIPLLAGYFLERHRRELTVDVRGISPEALEALARHTWPGNVRELESAIKFALVHASGDVITPAALPASVRGQVNGAPAESTPPGEQELADVRDMVRRLLSQGAANLSETVHGAVDRILLEQVLASVGGHQARAAEILGLSRNTLRVRLQQLGLTVGKIVQDEQ